MNSSEYRELQIGMYVTDVECEEGVAELKEDFCIVQEFDRMGRMKLQPLDSNGRPSQSEKPYWIHYKDYDLKDKMFKSEFNEFTV